MKVEKNLHNFYREISRTNSFTLHEYRSYLNLRLFKSGMSRE
jgi:hypothetical protein